MRLRLVTCAAAIWAAMGSVVSADGPVVVELFTSQGCSSCPPADRILGEIASRDDVIALALHVDYWDYIGWKDIFASPAFTQRQRAYARAAGARSIYTPQMVIGGQDHIVGTKPMDLAKQIQRHAEKPDEVDVSLARSGDKIRIEAVAKARVPSDMVVQIVSYTPKETVNVRRGENAGRQLDYHNIVREWVDVGTWDGRSDFRASVTIPSGTHVAVLVQEKNAGRILGAAKLR